MQPCIAWVWPADWGGPVEKRLEVAGELALDRELLCVTDASVSRAANAPRLVSLSSNRVLLTVPERSAVGVVVVHGTDFGSLQRGVPPVTGGFQLAPAALGQRSRVVFGPRSCLVLCSSMNRAQPGLREHLVSLPHAERVDPGNELNLAAPAILMVGMNAVSVLAGATVSPNSAAMALEPPRSFRLPEVGVSLSAAQELDAFLPARPLRLLRIAGYDDTFLPAQLPQIGREILTRLQRHYVYVPVLLDDREPRLALLYERQDHSVGAQISDANIAEWLSDITEALSIDERPQATARQVSSGRQASSTRQGRSLSSSEPRTNTSVSSPPRDLAAASTLTEPAGFGGVLTHSSRFAEVLKQVEKVAAGDLRLLFLGESGTGKEHLARAVHALSPRAAGPFVAINCSAVPEALIESELFGHQKGAFTGTQGDRAGVFQSADGGTLLLDEIGDAPLRVQLALLRVLETRSIRPVGADQEQPVDVRVLAATSRSLPELILAERFREDLYFRLAELPVTLPPLRERASDLALITYALLEAEGCGKPLSSEALLVLRQHPWPGNIRELRNAVRRAVLFSAGTDTIAWVRCFPRFRRLQSLARFSFRKPYATSRTPCGQSALCRGWVWRRNTNGVLYIAGR